jgi:hypothetical protein
MRPRVQAQVTPRPQKNMNFIASSMTFLCGTGFSFKLQVGSDLNIISSKIWRDNLDSS